MGESSNLWFEVLIKGKKGFGDNNFIPSSVSELDPESDCSKSFSSSSSEPISELVFSPNSVFLELSLSESEKRK